jgi:hypothetical protein
VNGSNRVSTIQATTAVDLLYQNLQALPHPAAGLVRLTMFAHESDGIRTLKRQVSESVILLLESNGYHICNGLSEAQALLESAGYAVVPPSDAAAVDVATELAGLVAT